MPTYIQSRYSTSSSTQMKKKQIRIPMAPHKMEEDLLPKKKRKQNREVDEIPDIRENLSEKLKNAWDQSAKGTEPITRFTSLTLTRDNYKSLQYTQWLDDAVINAYGNMLQQEYEENLYLPAGLFARMWESECKDIPLHDFTTKDVSNINLYHKIMFPICVGSHWTLIVADTTTNKISYMDSLHGVSNIDRTVTRSKAFAITKEALKTWGITPREWTSLAQFATGEGQTGIHRK
mmetsp:Transcript_22464/g.37667  ORF Transcript_22464/g.37667 Transcript_22464/m.37667 type:complete len:234 (-) Transcript_22464:1306-2007(-)